MPKPSKKISKSSDSDSDDSQDARLREAAVTIDDINKNNEKTIEINNSKNTDDNSFKIEVTPEFQNFVAKKLTTILDNTIELVEYIDESNGNNQDTQVVAEVKKKKKKKFKLTKDILFIDYEGKTNHEQEVVKNNDINNKKNKKREHTSSSDEDLNEKMCAEAAVSSSSIYKSSCINQHKNN